MEPKGIYNPVINPKVGQGNGIDIIRLFLNNFITIAFVIGIVIAFFVLLTGAISWISSGGEKEKIQKAQGKITGALIGLVVLFSLYAILKLIGGLFGIDLLSLPLPIIE